MTHEEALYRVKGYLTDLIPAEDYSEVEEIIEALEQQPCEDMPCVSAEEMQKCKDIVKKYTPKQQPCDDAVSRVAVCEIISDIRDCISVEGYCAIIERLKKLPPVTPQKKSGHWIAVYQGDEIINYRCSECELGDTNGSTNLYGWDYCRKCGAKMQESEE